jgi:7,8-dihydropterin-6-yl-methyl-4-(beta-D-ribofuranosyl)aminobenzene 5'-phosphate synthase
MKTFLICLVPVVFTQTVVSSAGADPITMTVLYDNYVNLEGTTADWGFSCIIEGTERTILFDTGYRGNTLLQNAEVLGIDIAGIDDIVLSHNHLDHTGGLDAVLGINPHVPVYFGQSFPSNYDSDISNAGAVPIRVDESIELCNHILSTGELVGPIREQSLILETDEGLVVITGCSHPGIINILQVVHELMEQDIYLVFGGFHLMDHSDAQVQQIIDDMKSMGVQKVGPTHCTGDRAIELFRAGYGDDCLDIGVGKIIQVTMDEVNVQDGDSRLVPELLLGPGTPNPFDSETVIPFRIPMEDHVSLSVFDLGGEYVAPLWDGIVTAGFHSARWDGTDFHGEDVASGTYIVTAQVGTHHMTTPLILLR